MINTLEHNVMNLSKREQDNLFRILTDNADLLSKIIPDIPLLDYILTGNRPRADHALVEAYDIWKNNN